MTDEEIIAWRAGRERFGQEQWRSAKRDAALADYEKLCEQGEAPPPEEYFTTETLLLCGDKIARMVASRRGSKRGRGGV